MIAFGNPTDLVAVLGKVCDRVASSTTLPRSRVFLFAGRAVDLMAKTDPRAERFVAVWAKALPVNPVVKGGGGAFTVFDAELTLSVCGRNGLDAEKADFARLSDHANGLAGLVNRVVKAVQVWPAIEGSDSVLVEPARLLPGGPQFDPDIPPAGWCWCRVPLQCKFRFDATA